MPIFFFLIIKKGTRKFHFKIYFENHFVKNIYSKKKKGKGILGKKSIEKKFHGVFKGVFSF